MAEDNKLFVIEQKFFDIYDENKTKANVENIMVLIVVVVVILLICTQHLTYRSREEEALCRIQSAAIKTQKIEILEQKNIEENKVIS